MLTQTNNCARGEYGKLIVVICSIYPTLLIILLANNTNMCHNIITLYRCLFCSYIFYKRESKLYYCRSTPADIKSPAGNGTLKALTHLLFRQETKSHLYKVFLHNKKLNLFVQLSDNHLTSYLLTNLITYFFIISLYNFVYNFI